MTCTGADGAASAETPDTGHWTGQWSLLHHTHQTLLFLVHSCRCGAVWGGVGRCVPVWAGVCRVGRVA